MSSIVVSSNTLNRNGYVVLSSGIDISKFMKNPIMLYNHERGSKYGNQRIAVVGRWNDVKLNGGDLMATPIFDTDDAFGVELDRKYRDGFMSSFSIGIMPIEWSYSMVAGQEVPTIIKSELIEISCVDIPANTDACCMYDKEGAIVPLELQLQFGKKENMKNVFALMGLGELATESELITKIQELKNQVIKQSERADAAEQQLSQDRAKLLIESALASKKITSKDSEVWMSLAETNYEQAKKALDSISGFTSPTQRIKDNAAEAAGVKTQEYKYEQLLKSGGLVALQQSDPDEFNRIESEYKEALRRTRKL